MAKCLLCTRRRGTRRCRALSGEICPPCCGLKRRRGVNCPEDCDYLKSGRAHQEEQLTVGDLLHRVRELNPEYVNGLEYSIVQVRSNRFRDLLDREVREALENVLKTVETGEKGLIYDYRSPDPRVQIVADSVKKRIEEFQNRPQASGRVEVVETKACLLAAIATIKSLLRRNPDSTAYLDLISQYARPPKPDSRPTGLIHLP